MLLLLPSILQLSLLATAVSEASLSMTRRLEDANSYAKYRLQSGPCFRIKIAENNDDDGNSYFYNGAYRAQYSTYMSYEICSNESNDCKSYVSDLSTYLESTVTLVQDLCESCQASCRRSLRNLENQGDDGAAGSVDCSSCSSVCQSIQNSNGGDETQYLECQKSDQQSDDGIQYYIAPQCEDGVLVIGQFYDNECLIKASKGLSDFGYATFGAIQAGKFDCSYDDTCTDLVDESTSCYGSESKLCRAAANASRVKAYKKRHKKMPVAFIVISALFFSGAFCFLSYTYYVRHKHHSLTTNKVPMAELDGNANEEAPLPALA
ncbi:hypothetical protein MPSEU_000908100 [Mayamaea pseudoterrestris]|nr:hypothetical protein MPSEU_000908100 [Mayamaea pseudoterrestris]